MTYSSRSGRKVSEYHKNVFNEGGSLSGSQANAHISVLHRDTANIVQIKHIRGFITLGPSQTSVSGTPAALRAIICLVRYPTPETLNATDLVLDASWVLHPVPVAVLQYPQSVPYEFNAITMGTRETLYLVLWPLYTSESFTYETTLLWDQRSTPG